jgi:diguanylate cyclase (GGDEF)-like protein
VRPDAEVGVQRISTWVDETFGLRALLPMHDRDAARLHRLAGVMRVTIILLMMGVLLFLVRDETWWVPALVIAWMSVGVVVTWWLLRRHRRIPPHIWFRDTIALSIVSFVSVDYVVPAMLSSLAMVSFTALTARKRTVIALGSFVTAALSVPALWHGTIDTRLATVILPFALLAAAGPALVSSTNLQRSLEINERISDELGLCLWETDEQPGVPSTANYLFGNTERLLGQPSDIVMTNAGWESLLHPDDLGISAEIDEAIRSGRSYSFRYRQRAADGGYRWVEEVGHVECDVAGVPTKVRGMTHDVTRLVEATQFNERFDVLLDSLATSVGVMRLEDPDDPLSLTLLWQNEAGWRLTGERPAGTRIVDYLPELFDLKDHQGIGYVMAEVAAGRRPATMQEGTLVRNGRSRSLSMTLSPLPDRCVAVCAEDRTELAATRVELERLAYSDPLTGLPNRLRFRQLVGDATVGSHVVGLDIDHFDDINDAFGHACGDEVVAELARLLVDAPTGVVVARIGGDDFGLLVPPGVANRGDIGPRLLEVLARPLTLPNGLTLQVSASIGVTTKSKATTSADELLRQVDVATNRAKRLRSHVEGYDPRNDTSAPHRMMLLGEMRRAIRNGELELHYHPMIDLVTGGVVRMEGLLRWRHPALGLLPPSDFIEMTELSNLNAAVVSYCVDAVIAQATTWAGEGRPVPVSVNVGGSTLHDEALVESIVDKVRAAGLPSHSFGLELAERQIVLGSDVSQASLRRLADAGVWLSIDDFGAGNSSLLAVRTVPAHELKIDQAFIDDLRRGDSSMIGAIVTMALNVGLQVVAEGVEDELSVRWLRANGVSVAQGFLFGRPAPASELTAPWSTMVSMGGDRAERGAEQSTQGPMTGSRT